MRLTKSNALSHVIAMQGQPFQKMLNKPSRRDNTMAGRIECFEAREIIYHGIRHHRVIEIAAKMIVKDDIANAKTKMRLT